MKDLLNSVSDLGRISVSDLKQVLTLIRLVSLIYAVRGMENSKLTIDIPSFGKVTVTEDFDFEFVPDAELKKDVFGIKQDPNFFLKNELKKILNIGENNE